MRKDEKLGLSLKSQIESNRRYNREHHERFRALNRIYWNLYRTRAWSRLYQSGDSGAAMHRRWDHEDARRDFKRLKNLAKPKLP